MRHASILRAAPETVNSPCKKERNAPHARQPIAAAVLGPIAAAQSTPQSQVFFFVAKQPYENGGVSPSNSMALRYRKKPAAPPIDRRRFPDRRTVGATDVFFRSAAQGMTTANSIKRNSTGLDTGLPLPCRKYACSASRPAHIRRPVDAIGDRSARITS